MKTKRQNNGNEVLFEAEIGEVIVIGGEHFKCVQRNRRSSIPTCENCALISTEACFLLACCQYQRDDGRRCKFVKS